MCFLCSFQNLIKTTYKLHINYIETSYGIHKNYIQNTWKFLALWIEIYKNLLKHLPKHNVDHREFPQGSSNTYLISRADC